VNSLGDGRPATLASSSRYTLIKGYSKINTDQRSTPTNCSSPPQHLGPARGVSARELRSAGDRMFGFGLQHRFDRVDRKQILFVLLLISALFRLDMSASAQCTPNPNNNTLTICTPLNNQTVSSPFTVSAEATSSAAVTKFLVYLDSVLKYQQLNTKSISTSISAGAGTHNLTVQYYNGAWIKATEYITVGSSSGISVTVSPASATLAPGGTQQFTANVTGTTNTSVTWAVDGMYGGNTTVGTISTSGLYTAPSGSGSHTVTATSAADTTKTGAATVTVTSSSGGGCNPPTSPGAVICSPSAGSTVSSPVQFSGAGTGASGSVNHLELWIDGGKINDYPGNTMSASVALANGSHTATLVEVDSKGAYIKSSPDTFTVGASTGGVSVSINPTSATVATGGQQQFSATVSGTSNTSVTWSVDGTAGGSSTVGTVSTSGLYTAPSTTGTHMVTATSVADSTKSASATVTVITPGTCGGGSNNTISICAPANGASVTSPFQVIAQANSSASVSKFLVYIDSVLVYQQTNTSSINTTVSAAVGTHNLVVQYYNGNWIKGAETITVTSGGGGGGGSCSPPSSPGAVICTPAAGSSVSSPVTFTGAGTGASGSVNHLELWVDGTKINDYPGSTMTASVPLSGGSHTATLVEVDSSGAYLKSTPDTFTVSSGGGGGGGTVAVTTYHNDVTREGANTAETTLTTANVNSSSFGKLATYAVDGQVYPQPLVLPNLTINGGAHNVLYVATEHDSVYAFDADGGGTLWSKSLLGPGMSPVSSSDTQGVSPEIGVLATPVIDRNSGTIYLVAMVNNSGQNQWWLHALDVTNGGEKFGGPVRINPTVSGTGAGNVGGKLSLEGGCYQRTGLALANGNIYVGFGHCSHGWEVAFNAGNLQQIAVFNSSPNGKGAAIWSSGGAPAVDSSGNLFIETGVDADSTVNSGYSNAFMKLSPGLGVIDYFIPSNTAYLTSNDADIGSGSPIIMPDNSSSHPHELIGAGKDGRIFVIDRDHMGGFSSSGNNVVQIVQSGARQFDNFFDTPAFWNGHLYYHAEGDVLREFDWSNGLLSTSPVAVGTAVFGTHGATPSVSSNGGSDGIVWELDTGGQPSNPAILYAYDANNVGTMLYNSNDNASRDSAGPAVKFTVPTIANGKVYVPAGHQVNIYGLLH